MLRSDNQGIVKDCKRFLGALLRKIRLKKISSVYKYSKKEWLNKAQSLSPQAWAKEYTRAWKRFMRDKNGRETLIREKDINERVGMQLVFKKIKQDFPNSATLLEVGGGTGEFSIRLAQMGYNVVCTECCPKKVALGKKKIKCLRNESRHRIDFKEAFAENLPFPNNLFDGVVCMEVLEHLVVPQKAISEFYRALKERGKVYVTVPYRNFIDSPFHIHEFTRESIRIMFEKYFNVECVELCPFFPGQSDNQIFLVGEKNR